MCEGKIIIIDKTLDVLWEKYRKNIIYNILNIKRLIELLHTIGNTYIELPLELYNLMSRFDISEKIKISSNNKLVIPSGREIYKNIEEKGCNIKRISGLSDLLFFNYSDYIKHIIEKFGAEVELEVLDEYGLATAISNEWLQLGGTTIVGTFAGIGGYAPLEEIICTSKFVENRYVTGDTRVLPQIAEMFKQIFDSYFPDNKPIIGEKIFHVESGIHVDGIVKNSSNYEPYPPMEVGRERKIIVGKYTGINAFQFKLNELNIKMDSHKVKIALEEIKVESIKVRRSLSDNEICDICRGINAI